MSHRRTRAGDLVTLRAGTEWKRGVLWTVAEGQGDIAGHPDTVAVLHEGGRSRQQMTVSVWEVDVRATAEERVARAVMGKGDAMKKDFVFSRDEHRRYREVAEAGWSYYRVHASREYVMDKLWCMCDPSEMRELLVWLIIHGNDIDDGAVVRELRAMILEDLNQMEAERGRR